MGLGHVLRQSRGEWDEEPPHQENRHRTSRKVGTMDRVSDQYHPFVMYNLIYFLTTCLSRKLIGINQTNQTKFEDFSGYLIISNS